MTIQERADEALAEKGGGLTGASNPRYMVESMGQPFEQAGALLEQSVAQAGAVLKQALERNVGAQQSLYSDSAEYAAAFALERDFRSRYCSTSYLRKNALHSSRRASFIQNVISHLAKPE